MATMDRNEFVREVLTLIHVRCRPSPLWPFIHLFLSFFSWFDPLFAVAYPLPPCLPPTPTPTPYLPLPPKSPTPYVATKYQCSCIVNAMYHTCNGMYRYPMQCSDGCIRTSGERLLL